MKNLKQLIRQTFPTILMLMAFCTTVQAQITVTGNVTDGAADPLIGASVIVKGNASLGTVTDFDGNFTIDAPANGTLVVSYVGYKDREITVEISNGTCRGPLYLYGSTNERFSFLINNLATDLDSLCLLHRCHRRNGVG